MRNSHNPCEAMFCSTSEMSASLRRLAEPVRAGESIKALIGKAARRANMSYSRVRELWYGRAKVSADEIERVRGLLRAKSQEDVHEEIAALRARLEALEAQIASRRP